VIVAVLGPAEIRVVSDRRLRSAHKRTLLAALALETGREVTRQRLIDLIWGAAPPRTATHALEVYVSDLRAMLGDRGHGLVTAPTGYRFDTAIITTDAELVVELVGAARAALVVGRPDESAMLLTEALQHWRGVPFVELGEDARAEAERARLDSLLAEIHEELADAYLALGRHAELIPELESRISTDPFRERPYAQLMTALAALGRRADALGVYERARVMLRDQLGVEPGLGLRSLERTLRSATDTAIDGGTPTSRPEAPRRQPFVGRSDELARLTTSADAVARGHGAIVLIGGEPGLGKSRLVGELGDQLTSTGGWSVWRSRCPDAEGVPALWTIADALRHADDFDAGLHADDERVAPLIELVLGHAPRRRATDLGEPPDAFQLHQAVAELLVDSISDPTMLVLDDLHWADSGTLGVLTRLATMVERAPLLVVATHRNTTIDRSELFDRTVAMLARETAVDLCELSQLTDDDVIAYVAGAGLALGEVELARLIDRCEGNALFLTELVRLVDEGGPAPLDRMPHKLDDILATRIARTGAAADVLSAAALIGRDFPVDVLARLDTASGAAISQALGSGVHHGLLFQSSPGTYRFTHGLIADAAVERLDDDSRRELHLRIAEVMATRVGTDPGRRMTDVARHRLSALPLGDPTSAARACIAAGDQALAAYAYTDAAAHFAAARHAAGYAVGETSLIARALIGEGEALMAAGDNGHARPLLDDALALLDPAAEPDLYALAVRVLVLHRSAAGAAGDRQLADLLERAIAGLGARSDWLPVQLRTDLAILHYRTDVDGTTERLARDALALARHGGDDLAISFALTGLHQAIWRPSTLDERLGLATEAVVAARRAGLQWHESLAWSFHAADQWERGDLAGVENDLDHAAALASASHRPRFEWIARSWRALLDLARGDVPAAEAGFAAAMAVWGPTANPDAVMCFVAQQLTLRLVSGDTGTILPMLRDASVTDPDPLMWQALLSYPAVLAGDVAGANRSLDLLADGGVARLRPDLTQLIALAMASEAAAALDRRDVAGPVAAVLAPYADRRIVTSVFGGGGLWWGTVAHQLGLCAATLGNVDDARGWFTRAIELHDHDRTPFFTERSRLALAALANHVTRT
jgi:DNA-binding SARP family transcriptional activator